MKRNLLTIAVSALVVAVSFGCAITDYPVITDNDQTGSSAGNHVVNTAGKALIVPLDGQVVTIWSDGTDELLSYVDQDGKGNQAIYTYNNFCAAGAPCNADADGNGDNDYFAGMTFLNPDRTGCWIWKAPNPAENDVDIFDGSFNANCSGSRSLKSLISYSSRLAEVGRDGGNGQRTSGGSSPSTFSAGVSVGDGIRALHRLDTVGVYGDYRDEYGARGYKITLTPDNFELWLDGTRFMVDGVVAIVDVRNRGLLLDARTGNSYDMLNQLADWVDANGDRATLSGSALGLDVSFEVGLMGSDHYRALADRT